MTNLINNLDQEFEQEFNLIKNKISQHRVVLFLKGTKERALCGFSATVVNILNYLKVDYEYVNVLDDARLREAIKVFSDWPTIPQLYIKGEFIGGADITKNLYQSGELQKMLDIN